MTIIVDGMDQAKTNLPFTKVIAKSTSSLWRLRTHVTGVLLHTKAPCGKLAYAFVDLLQWPHDSNLTMTVLYNVLVDYCRLRDLPENLYLQMDNTSRENKNKYVLGFCAILVQLKIFKKVLVCCSSQFYSFDFTFEHRYSKGADKFLTCGSHSRRCRPIILENR